MTQEERLEEALEAFHREGPEFSPCCDSEKLMQMRDEDNTVFLAELDGTAHDCGNEGYRPEYLEFIENGGGTSCNLCG